MNPHEIALVVSVLVAFALGGFAGHAVGYGEAKRASRHDLRAAWERGHAAGRRDAASADAERERRITRPMPLVPVSVNGDEVDLSPKRAADVRLSE